MKTFIVPCIAAASWASPWADCDAVRDASAGPFGPVSFVNQTWNGTVFYSVAPAVDSDKAPQTYPLVVFMHGSTGQWGFYSQNLEHFSSHGAVVVFPFIKGPEEDKKPLTTNTDGRFLVKAVEYARAMNADAANPLFGRVNTANIVIAGHSMGATCSIMASKTLVDDPAVKLTITQHPGICGPFGPPPDPDTWNPPDMAAVAAAHPVLMTTATNDGAFWPAPLTAKHEHGCFEKVPPMVNESENKGMAFVQFSAAACAEDGAREPVVKDGGHMCPAKTARGGWPENVWLLAAIKLYTQQGGSKESKCFGMLWGNSTDSLRNSNTTDLTDVRPPPA